ncbi:MAG: tetratricopeptide repeat protein [Opitutaceae bacterium]|nr:tetratricopeptide repeat protein [Opitutaceae bacterium]
MFDDKPAIAGNPSIRQWTTALNPPDIGSGVTGRPLVNLSLALNHAVSGEAVWSYHALNLLIHAGAGLALFGIVRRTLLQPVFGERFRNAAEPLAFAIAALWLAHPLQTESVTSIIQRTESLVGLFYLLTLYGFVRSLDASPCARLWGAGSVAACLLGMAAKEVMVTAPLMVLLYDRTFAAGSLREALRLRGRYYLALACTWLLLGWLVLSGGGTRGEAAGFGLGVTPWMYALTQCRAVLLYLQLALWPHPLVFDYGSAIVRQPGEVWWQIIALAGLLGAAGYAWWRRLPSGFLGAWFFLILAPSSSVVPLVSQTIAEHRMYLPLAAVIALVVGWAYARLGRIALHAAYVLVPLAVLLTVQRNRDYRTEEILWADTVAKAPDNSRARINLAEVLINDGRPAEALEHAAEAVRLRPDHAEAQTNLGIACAQLGRPAEALAACGKAVELRPDYARGRSNYGIVLAQSGRWSEAITQFETALRLAGDAPDAVRIRGNLARALLRANRWDEAVTQFSAVLKAEPGAADMHYNLALALGLSGRDAEAIAELQTALQLDPGHAGARAALEAARGIR